MQNRHRFGHRYSSYNLFLTFIGFIRNLLLVLFVIGLFGFLQWVIETKIGTGN
jgi:hypothetical protein